MKTTTCNCGAEIEYEPIEGFLNLKPTVCDKCAIEAGNKAQKNILVQRNEKFLTICPPLYRDTKPEMISTPKKDIVLQWEYQPRGLLLYGEPRTFKTRLAWLVVKNLVLEGRTVEAMTSGEFALQSAENAGSEGRQWFHRLAKADVLFIDDFGKSKMTERVEADLFDVLEVRAANLKPCIITTNFGKDLEAKLTADRGPAIIARLREFCHPIHLKKA